MVWQTVWQTHDHRCDILHITLFAATLQRISMWVPTTPTNTTMEGLDKRWIDVYGAEKMALDDVHYMVIYLI